MNICKALLKHGYSNFELIILEYCEPSKCLEREGFYQKKFNPEYNIAQDPTAPMSGRKHSDDSKKIMSDAKKIDNPGGYKTGHEHSDETKTKISEAHKGKTLSNETKKKISDTKKGQPKVEGSGKPSQQIEVFDIKNNITTFYNSKNEAARALNIHKSVIDKYFSNNQQKPYKGQYTFIKTK